MKKMRKQYGAAMVAAGMIWSAAMLAGAQETEQVTEQVTEITAEESNIEEIVLPSCGLEFKVEQKYLDMGLDIQAYEDATGNPMAVVYYYYKEKMDQKLDEILALPAEEQTEEVIMKFYEELNEHTHDLMLIAVVEKETYEKQMAEGKTLDEISMMENTEELGEQEGFVYLGSVAEVNTEGLEEKEKEQLDACADYLPTLRENLVFTDVEETESAGNGELSQISPFTTTDLAGTEVTEEIFAQKDLTVVNIWGTFCTPCIEEMPLLGEWEEELPENVQIIGIVSDIMGKEDKEHVDLAVKIMEKAGAEFMNLIPSQEMYELLSQVVGVPTTLFVDKNGMVIGEPIVGADVEGYKKAVEDYLK